MTGEVSPLGHGDDRIPPAELRASHEDRDRVVELLRRPRPYELSSAA